MRKGGTEAKGKESVCLLLGTKIVTARVHKREREKDSTKLVEKKRVERGAWQANAKARESKDTETRLRKEREREEKRAARGVRLKYLCAAWPEQES